MSGVLRIEPITKGHILKQGDETILKYKLISSEDLSLVGKTAQIKLMSYNFADIGYQTTTTVQENNEVWFIIDRVIPVRTYYLEVIVDKHIFPSRSDEYKVDIDKSSLGQEANIIEIIGKDVLIREVKSQVDTELQPLVTSLNSAQQAETQRATAESNRVSAEEQRKIDHENRSSELAGKADKVVLKNSVENGDFSDGLAGWNLVGSPDNFSVIDGALRIIGPPTSAAGIRQDLKGSTTDKFYIRIHKYENLDDVLIRVFNYGTYTEPVSLYFGETNSHIVSKKDGIRFYIQTLSTVPETTNATIDEVCVINLTQTFSEGNEPTKEEMDELIKITGYIDSGYALNNKEMLVWTLALIRRNTSAIITLGGA